MITLKIDAATLAADAAWIAKGAARRTMVPVLATAHVSITDGGLRLRMTDYDMWREATTPAEGAAAADIAVLVDPLRLAAFLKGSKGDALVSVDSAGVEIVVGARTVTLSAATAELADYPEWPEFVATDTAAAVVDPSTIKRALVSVGKDATLPMLTGVRFDDGHMVTTDRFRLTRATYAAGGFDALVPAGALKLFTVGKGAVSVEYGRLSTMANPGEGEKRVRVSRGGRSVVVRELDCTFPKWRHLLPSEDNVTVIAAVRKADLLAALRGDSVDLEVRAEGTVHVSGRVLGEVVVSQMIAADVTRADGLPFTVRVSTKYVADALKGIAADVVTFWGTTPVRPLVFQAGADLHLIMPQRIPS